MEKENEVIDSTNDTETTENNDELELDLSDDDSVDVEALKKENATLKAQKDHWKKKANEKSDKTDIKADTSKEPSQDLSPKDALLLAKANVDIDDVDEVVDFAKYRKITIAEAIKNPTMQAILRDKTEQRQTAIATQTSNTRKSTSPSVDSILDKARKGAELSDDEIEKLTQARMDAKNKK